MYENITNEIYEEIKDKLMDPGFVNRYGTSATMNMSQEYKKYLGENFIRLKKEFDVINKDSDDNITREELVEFLKNSNVESKLEFDAEYIDKIYNLIDIDRDSHITM